MFGKKEGRGSKFNPDGSAKGSNGHAATLKGGAMKGEGMGSAKGMKPLGFGNGKGGKTPVVTKEKIISAFEKHDCPCGK